MTSELGLLRVAIVSIEDCLLFDSNLFRDCADLMPVSHIVICVVNVQASRNGIRVCDLVNDFNVFSEKYALPRMSFVYSLTVIII